MFETTDAKTQSVAQAMAIRNAIKTAYWQSKEVDRLLKLYTANTDPVFRAAVDTVYAASERAQLGAIAAKFAALVADIEANHRDVAGVSNE
jgi:hypothetical protein